jgi:excisionase family DNA binding protein
MNEQLNARPDYLFGICHSLLRIERLLADHPAPVAHARRALISINEAASVLGIGRSKFYRLIRRRQIQSTRVGRRVLIPAIRHLYQPESIG